MNDILDGIELDVSIPTSFQDLLYHKVMKSKDQGFSVVMDYHSLNEDSLAEALDNVIQSGRFPEQQVSEFFENVMATAGEKMNEKLLEVIKQDNDRICELMSETRERLSEIEKLKKEVLDVEKRRLRVLEAIQSDGLPE